MNCLKTKAVSLKKFKACEFFKDDSQLSLKKTYFIYNLNRLLCRIIVDPVRKPSSPDFQD